MASGTICAETGVSFTSRMVFFGVEWFLFGLDHLNGVFLTWNPLLSEMVFFCMEIVFFPNPPLGWVLVLKQPAPASPLRVQRTILRSKPDHTRHNMGPTTAINVNAITY